MFTAFANFCKEGDVSIFYDIFVMETGIKGKKNLVEKHY